MHSGAGRASATGSVTTEGALYVAGNGDANRRQRSRNGAERSRQVALKNARSTLPICRLASQAARLIDSRVRILADVYAAFKKNKPQNKKKIEFFISADRNCAVLSVYMNLILQDTVNISSYPQMRPTVAPRSGNRSRSPPPPLLPCYSIWKQQDYHSGRRPGGAYARGKAYSSCSRL